ncbi:7-cyano-7-deazaguanine synthase, partial [Patescibacteria group bacterium]|nr:7-cyano-7-deazaguanine synthase [Patescibacteria group bacterium]MBU1472157.1 7-cyano-7-deazaguanine synthase [Patescibacteria group bacterium]
KMKRRHFENIPAIQSVESYFQKTRGYVVAMPKPGEKIILLTSGGLDSTIVWYLLMKQFRLVVYPLFVGSNPFHPQRKSLYYFSHFFEKEFEKQYRPPFVMSQHLVAKEIDTLKKTKNIHSKILLNMYADKRLDWGLLHIAGLNALTPISAILYSKYLLLTKNLTIHTIVCAVAAGDGTVIKSQTFSFLRTTMFFLSQFFQDRELQFFSLLLDKNLGYFIEKAQLIQIGARLGLPIHKTYSCYTGKTFHCGQCLACQARRYEFGKANVTDRTIYTDSLVRKIQLVKNKIKSIVKRIFVKHHK